MSSAQQEFRKQGVELWPARLLEHLVVLVGVTLYTRSLARSAIIIVRLVTTKPPGTTNHHFSSASTRGARTAARRGLWAPSVSVTT